MASGIAHRRTKPAKYKLNVYPSRGSNWYSLRDYDRVGRYNAFRKSRRKCHEATHPEILGTIALEIVHEILLELDLLSLERMRQLNSHFQILVESLPAYRLLKQHASQTLQVIYLSGVASAISVKQLYVEFCQPSCRGCDSFGPFLFLPSVSRCCENCLQTKNDFQVFPLSRVYANFAITPAKARNWLPVVLCPEGRYGHPWSSYHFEGSIDLVSFAQVERLGIQTHGNKQRLKEAVMEKQANYTRRLASRRKKTYSHGSRPFGPGLPTTLQSHWEIKIREWKCCGATDLPFWDSKRRTIESGVYCSACGLYRCFEMNHNQRYDKIEGNNTAFTLDTIPQHFEQCEFVRRGYEFGDRYQYCNSKELGLDFLVNEKGEVEPHPASGNDVPRKYINPYTDVYVG